MPDIGHCEQGDIEEDQKKDDPARSQEFQKKMSFQIRSPISNKI